MYLGFLESLVNLSNHILSLKHTPSLDCQPGLTWETEEGALLCTPGRCPSLFPVPLEIHAWHKQLVPHPPCAFLSGLVKKECFTVRSCGCLWLHLLVSFLMTCIKWDQ